MKIVVYGVGKQFEKYFDVLAEEEVLALSDKSKEEIELLDRHYEVILPEKIKYLDYDYVVVTPVKGFQEIAFDLCYIYGVKLERIISLSFFLTKKDDFNYSVERGPLLRFLKSNHFMAADYLLSDNSVNFFNAAWNSLQNVVNYKGSLLDSGFSTNVSIFSVFHKPYKRICASGYYTIGVGNNRTDIECDFYDDLGDSISGLNNLINEATALYWIWKNDNSKIVGLNHYRRCFESPFSPGWPLQAWEAETILQQYDVIVAEHVWYEQETILQTMRGHVCKEAFDNSYPKIREIIESLYPNYLSCFDRFTEGKILFPCQMFIMRRSLLDEYCKWLFPIVFKMIERIEVDNSWDEYSKRIIGFWTERLLTVWLFSTEYHIYELPIMLLEEDIK